MGRAGRKNLMRKLWAAYGDRCYWCAGKMIYPPYGYRLEIPLCRDMATIEHYRAKKLGTGDNPIFLTLAHMRCNK